MIDILQFVADKRTLPTLRRLSENDINSIWDDVSNYIQHQMTLQKGVHVAGLGTFTFSQLKLDLGNQSTVIRRPIFYLSGRLVQSLGLKQVRPLAEATQLAVVQLNFSAVSRETPFGRDVVEGCVRETLLLLARALASEPNVFLTFQGIGVLFFRNNKVLMKFNRRFIDAMDGSGRLLLAFNNRPGSSASLLSGGASRLQRPHTANAVTIALPTVCSPRRENIAAEKDPLSPSPAPDQRNAGDVPLQGESKASQTLPPTKKNEADPTEERPLGNPTEPANKPASSGSPPGGALTQEKPRLSGSCSDHARAGQELCYLCMQRAQRNVPVHLREQQEAGEKVQEKHLLLQEQERVKKVMEEEQEKLGEQRQHAKKVAAFNLQISKEREKSYRPLLPTSFIFAARPLTPVRRTQQQRYRKELQSQMESRRHHQARDQQDRLLMERRDQVQLVQETALLKTEQLQQKQETRQNYRAALDAQVGDKGCKDPAEFPPEGTSWFPRADSAANNAESRERAQKLYQLNVSAATQRKWRELHSRQEQLEKDRETLKNNKMELILGCIHRFEKKRDVCKSLQDEWSRSSELKQQREEEERRFLRSAGQLLVDKLGEYKGCHQCKRRITNCGESNIWKDSNHLSGSQFIA